MESYLDLLPKELIFEIIDKFDTMKSFWKLKQSSTKLSNLFNYYSNLIGLIMFLGLTRRLKPNINMIKHTDKDKLYIILQIMLSDIYVDISKLTPSLYPYKTLLLINYYTRLEMTLIAKNLLISFYNNKSKSELYDEIMEQLNYFLL